MVLFQLVRGRAIALHWGGHRNHKTGLQGLPNKKQLENRRRTENTAKARGRQAGKPHKENQSRSVLRTQQPRQAERARENRAGLLKDRFGATTQGQEQEQY
eukprot:scaffold52178_cov15-Tisochrysis_lutea.AAC.3